jgi:hypothetical protein
MINDEIDDVFANIDNMLYDERFVEVDEMLESTIVPETDLLVLLSLLTATDPWKDKLTHRPKFYRKVESAICEKYARRHAEELLYGLK